MTYSVRFRPRRRLWAATAGCAGARARTRNAQAGGTPGTSAKECQRLPREERDRLQTLLKIEGFLQQRNISAKNIGHLKSLSRFPSEEVRQKADLVLEVAQVAPHRRRRRGYLAHHRPDLLNRLVQQGLLPGYLAEGDVDVGAGDEGPEEIGGDTMPFFP